MSKQRKQKPDLRHAVSLVENDDLMTALGQGHLLLSEHFDPVEKKSKN